MAALSIDLSDKETARISAAIPVGTAAGLRYPHLPLAP
jgi:hypothetical protein